MEEVGLQTALAKWPCLVDAIFACEKDRTLTGDEFKGKITFEERDASTIPRLLSSLSDTSSSWN